MLIVLLIAVFLLAISGSRPQPSTGELLRLSLLLDFQREYRLKTGSSLTLPEAEILLETALPELARNAATAAVKHQEACNAKALVSSLCEDAERRANYLDKEE